VNTNRLSALSLPVPKIKIQDGQAIFYDKQQGTLEVENASNLTVPDKDSRPSTWSVPLVTPNKEVIDFGFVGGTNRVFVAYRQGIIELYDISLRKLVWAVDAKMSIDGIAWSPSFGSFGIFGGSTVKRYETGSGSLLQIYENFDAVIGLQILESGALVTSRESYVFVPSVDSFSDETELSNFADAITPHWALEKEMANRRSLVLPMLNKPHAIDGLEFCKLPSDDRFSILGQTNGASYFEACSAFSRESNVADFGAFVVAQLSHAYSNRAGSDNFFLPYQLVRFGGGDPVAFVTLGSRMLQAAKRGMLVGCESPPLHLSRRLFEAAILREGPVAPDYFLTIVACDGSGSITKDVTQKLLALAKLGDPFAHATVAFILERDVREAENALAHYLAAAIILHRVEAQLFSYKLELAARAWADAGQLLELRRVSLARFLGRDSVLAAIAKAHDMVSEVSGPEGAPRFVSPAPQSISDIATTWSKGNLPALLSTGEQKLRDLLGDAQRPIVDELIAQTRFLAAKQFLDGGIAADDGASAAQSLFLDTLRIARELQHPDLFASAALPALMALSKETDASEFLDILRKLTQEVWTNIGKEPSDYQTDVRRKYLPKLIDIAHRGGDRQTEGRLKINALSIAENNVDKSNWQQLANAYETVVDFLASESNLFEYRPELLQLRLRYIEVGRDLWGSRDPGNKSLLSGDLSTAGQRVVNGGLALHQRMEELFTKYDRDYVRLSVGFNVAGLLAERDGEFDTAYRYYDQELTISREVNQFDATGQSWRDLAIGQTNLLRMKLKLKPPAKSMDDLISARTEEMLVDRQEIADSWKMAKTLGNADAPVYLFNTLQMIAGLKVGVGRYEEGLINSIDAYTSLSQGDRRAIGTARLKSQMLISGYAIVSLYRKLQLAKARVEPAELCDVMAGHPDDPLLPTKPVDFQLMDADAAIRECDDAIRRHPDNPRFVYEHARAISKRNGNEAAREEFQRAADLGYLAAYNNLSIYYEDINLERAAKLKAEFVNRVIRYYGRVATKSLLERGVGLDSGKFVRAALLVTWWAGELGDAMAHEKLAAVFQNDAMIEEVEPLFDLEGNRDRKVLAMKHLRIAHRLYDEKSQTDRVVGSSAMLKRLEDTLNDQQRIAADGIVSSWKQKDFDYVPSWMTLDIVQRDQASLN
jgi:hypothetical protein